MENLSLEMKQALERIAYSRTTPFCYSCYIDAPSGYCVQCGSDDLMASLPGCGVDWGIFWVVEHIVAEILTAVDTSEAFEDSIRGCYEETIKIGWIEYDVVNAIKELDPISFELAESEWIDGQCSEGNLITFDNGSNYYWLHDLERFIEENEVDQEAV